MHILHIYKDYAPVLGGIENHVRDLAEAQAARGHRVTVLVTSLDRHTRIERPIPNLAVIKAARMFHAASTPLSLAMLAYARGTRPDVVHLHVPFPPGDLVARAVPGRPPLVLTYHSDIVRQKLLLRMYRPLLQATLHRAARIIATSPAYIASSPFLSHHAAKCVVVPLGIDVNRFTPIDERPTTKDDCGVGARLPASSLQPPASRLLFVGRLRYYKGLHVLLDAMPCVDATLVIAGSGPERARLEAQAQQLGIAERVRFLGDVPDTELPALYRGADVFVLPAHLRAEALGIAQIEALASGLPCVSTELGTGTSFANVHGETGLVIPPGDSVALSDALNTLLGDEALRRRFGHAARQRAETLFSRERMVKGVERVYREVGRTK